MNHKTASHKAKQNKTIHFIKTNSQTGSVTLEYILLTIFGAMTAIAAVTFLNSSIQKQIQKMQLQLEQSFDDSSVPKTWEE